MENKKTFAQIIEERKQAVKELEKEAIEFGERLKSDFIKPEDNLKDKA